MATANPQLIPALPHPALQQQEQEISFSWIHSPEPVAVNVKSNNSHRNRTKRAGQPLGGGRFFCIHFKKNKNILA